VHLYFVDLLITARMFYSHVIIIADRGYRVR
jgi:hypothetical protein